MSDFVKSDSIVRKIWGKADTILIIFAGASAEFALNKAVDWLYFTGKLPADPLGRLFSTVSYARQIVFSETRQAFAAIDRITAIHQQVEHARDAKIPDWAYRDVLFMLIDYSVRSYELLERKLSHDEKQEVFDVFHRVGLRMHLAALPENYEQWLLARQKHLDKNLMHSHFTTHLYQQYQKHLGWLRYRLLLQTQALVVPEQVQGLLDLSGGGLLRPLLKVYQLSRSLQLDNTLKSLILPNKYLDEIKNLDIQTR
jgi:hypothetical protein